MRKRLDHINGEVIFFIQGAKLLEYLYFRANFRFAKCTMTRIFWGASEDLVFSYLQQKPSINMRESSMI